MNYLYDILQGQRERKEIAISNWQKDKRRKVSNSDKQLFCSGCRQNFYNGHNDLGIDECWSLDKAKLKKRELYLRVDSTETENIITLNCFVRKYR